MPKCEATLLKSHLDMGVLLQIYCIFSEHLFLRTPPEGCFYKRNLQNFNFLPRIYNNLNVLFKGKSSKWTKKVCEIRQIRFKAIVNVTVVKTNFIGETNFNKKCYHTDLHSYDSCIHDAANIIDGAFFVKRC